MTLLAFNKDKKLKAGLLKEVHKHYEQDQIIKGTYGDASMVKFRGCAVGCSIDSYNRLTGEKNYTGSHVTFEKFGFPEWLARVQDTIFEGLPKDKSVKWPERFFKAVRPGADLNKIKGPFLVFVLQSDLKNVDKKKFPYVVKSIKDIIALHKRKSVTAEEWSAAESAARSAARSAWSAAESARSARSAAYVKFANKLISLMKAA